MDAYTELHFVLCNVKCRGAFGWNRAGCESETNATHILCCFLRHCFYLCQTASFFCCCSGDFVNEYRTSNAAATYSI
ncbi:hypothetical protein D1872_258790 [compost metagenome]